MGKTIASKTRILRDIETGEIIETEEVIKVINGRIDFEILYLDAFCQILDKLGGKKYQILKYILEHRDLNNCVVTSIRKMATELNIAQATVAQTMRILRDAGVIYYNHGGLTMVNPKIINRKSTKGERYLLQRFVELQQEQSTDDTVGSVAATPTNSVASVVFN